MTPAFLVPLTQRYCAQVTTPRATLSRTRSSYLGRSGICRSLHRVLPTALRACSETSSSSAADDALTPEEREHQDLIKALDAKPLKWSEIPFSSIQEELDAIDEYEKEEDLNEDDPWPKFLRGAAYEHWGQPQLALAQYAKTWHAGGLRRVPELWERRAYNAFKIGNVAAANSYYEIALGLFYESCGNELHFVHWFYENFQDYLPKWNGPAAPVQRGICKYCVGMPTEARQSFMPQIAVREPEIEHALLWFLAAAVKASSNGIIGEGDGRVVSEALGEENDWNPRLALFFKLYHAAARGVFGEVTDAENELSELIKADDKDDICTNVYLALYHDAFTKDQPERDRALDIVAAIGSTPSTHNTENFLFYAAKHRFSIPKGHENAEVPERSPI